MLVQNAPGPLIALSVIAAAVVPLRSLPQNAASAKPSSLPPRKLPQAVAVTGREAVADVQLLATITDIVPLVDAKR